MVQARPSDVSAKNVERAGFKLANTKLAFSKHLRGGIEKFCWHVMEYGELGSPKSRPPKNGEEKGGLEGGHTDGD